MPRIQKLSFLPPPLPSAIYHWYILSTYIVAVRNISKLRWMFPDQYGLATAKYFNKGLVDIFSGYSTV